MPQVRDRPVPDRLTDIEQAIAALAKEPLAPDEFFLQFLANLQEIIPLRMAAVWGLNQQGVLEKVAEVTGAEPFPADSASARRRIHHVLSAITAGESQSLAEPHPGEGNFVTLLTPLLRQSSPIGAIEVHVEGAVDDPATQEIQSIVATLARYASEYIARLATTPPAATQKASASDSVAMELHRSLEVTQVALTAANEGRRLLGCDRLSIAIRTRGKTRIAAVSGRDRVAERSESVQGLRTIADLVFASGRGCQFAEPREATGSPVDQALEAHAAQSGARWMEAIPLVSPVAKSDRDEQQLTGPAPGGVLPCAVMIVEQFTAAVPEADRREVQQFAEHAALALANAERHERLIGAWPSRLLGRFYAPSEKPQARRALLWSGVALAAMVLVGFLPAPYRVETCGELMPAVRSFVFAPNDGEVRDILVTGGQHVQQGDLLLRLTSERLTSEILAIENRLRQQQQMLAMLAADSDHGPLTGDDAASHRLQGRIAQSEIEIDGLRTRLAELKSEQSRLDIRAAHAGYVATFQPERLLGGRPVGRGDKLLELMDFDGDWRLQLDLPVSQFGHVTAATAAAEHASLPVHFVLATQPERTFDAAVTRVANRTTTSDDGGAIVEIEAAVDSTNLARHDHSLAGSQVIARIDCGRKPLAYVLLGSAYDYVRRWWW